MNRKKIIIFSEDFPPVSGGIAQWAAGVAKSLHRQGQEVRVLTRYRHKYAAYSGSYEFPIIYMKGKRWKQLRSWYCHRSIKSIYQQGYQTDLIIATTWNFARGITNLARKNQTKIITVVHGLEVTRKMSFIKKLWLQRTLKKSDLVVAVSQFTQDRVIENYSVDGISISVIPNGVDISKFDPKLDILDLKNKFGIKDEKIILTLARVIERKGHDKVIEALPKIKEKIPNVKYIIAGDWEENYFRKLKALVTELQLDQTVIFTGYVPPDQVKYFYNLCDVYIMPSRELKEKGDTEGFGITFLEANACEKPVIGGDSGGVSEAVVDGETGFLVDPLAVDDIAEKLIRLLSDAELAHRLGKQGRQRIEREFTWDIISEKIMKSVYG